MAEQIRAKAGNLSAWPTLGLMAFGAYLLVGSYYGFTHERWPWFMPPQLDVFGLFIGLFGDKTGGYVGGALLGAPGLLLVFSGFVVLVRRDV